MRSIIKKLLPKKVIINLAIEWLEEAAEDTSNSVDDRVVQFIKKAYYTSPVDTDKQDELSDLLSKAARSIRDRVRNIRKRLEDEEPISW